MPGRPEDGEAAKKKVKQSPGDQPPGEEEFGGGDFCSPEIEPSTDDDKPLD